MSDPTGSDFVQSTQAAVSLSTATDDSLQASSAVAIVVGGGQASTLKAGGDIELRAVEVDTLSASDEATKVANIQALDDLLRVWDQSAAEEPRRVAWGNSSTLTDDVSMP